MFIWLILRAYKQLAISALLLFMMMFFLSIGLIAEILNG